MEPIKKKPDKEVNLMPKLPVSPEQQALDVADTTIQTILTRNKLDYKKTPVICRFGTKAYYNRRDDAGEWKVSELQRLARKTDMGLLEAASIILGRKVTAKDIKEFLIIL